MYVPNKTVASVIVSLLLVVSLSGWLNFSSSGLTLKLTDPTPTNLVSVWVTITKIEAYSAEDIEESNPIVVFEDEGGLEVDLLDILYPETTTVVQNIELEPGDYNHFKLYLKEFQVEVDGKVNTYHAWAWLDSEGTDSFPCRVPSGKFNVEVWDPVAGEDTYFTKEEGVLITVIIDFRWNGNVANNPSRNLNPTGKAYVEVVVLPDISISKIGPAEIVQGNGATYTITIGFEDAVAKNVIVTDTLPNDMSFDSSSDGGVYDDTTRQVTWNLGDIDPGTTTEITLTLTGDVAGERTNTVSVTCDEGMYAEAEADTLVTAPPS